METKLNNETIIKVEHLSKTIKKVQILEDINLKLFSKKIYGFQGKNGSGKTMIMRAICGLIKPTKGTVSINQKVLGKDMSFPEHLGLLIETPAFLHKYTGFKNLKMLASIQRIINDKDIIDVLEKVGLDPNDKRTYRKYSLGMKQRLGIACAIMEKPNIIVLDEPINALDENGVILVRKILKEEKERGAIVIIACHDKEEMEILADEIYLVEEGRITGHMIVNKECD